MGHTPVMQVLLDGQALAVSKPTLAAALRSAVDAAQQRGRIIIEVKGDGQRIADDLLAAPSDEVCAIRTLAFISEDPRQLVARSFDDAGSVLANTKEAQQRVSERIQSGEVSEALDQLSECFTAWQAVHDVVSQGCGVLGWQVDSITLGDGSTLGMAVGALRGHLRSLKDALGSEDWSAVSDLVGYDLDAQADLRRVLLAELSQRALDSGPGTA